MTGKGLQMKWQVSINNYKHNLHRSANDSHQTY